ncbi:hypothetical protein ONZ45_g9036 [Pleurotus djamor]|nr:hypothetical protein ONZ45_g9036 [Pleurotus djamor]
MKEEDYPQEKQDYDRSVETDAEGQEGFLTNIARKLRRWGVEARGIQPVSADERTDRQYNRIFYIWLSVNLNISCFSIGALAPSYGFGLRDAFLVILFFNLVFNAFPAYFCTWGPKLGLRQMIQARYSFGYFGVLVPCVLNLMTMTGYAALSCIVGGQTLSAVSTSIVIVGVISLMVSFCGYKFLSWFDRLAWIPVFIVCLVMIGVGGKSFGPSKVSTPATIQAVFSYGAPIGSAISCKRIFIYSYLGLILPTASMQFLGAACAIAAANVPTWEQGFANTNVGGLIAAILQPTGNFGKFLITLLALGVIANISMNVYCFCLNLQVFIPFLARVPRYLFSLVSVGIIIPISIVGSHSFADTLSNLLGLIGYWASPFASIILTEHFVFRRADHGNYDLKNWDSPKRLALGLAALAAGAAGTGMGVACMNQAWFVGPIAKFTGDIGLEVPFAVAFLLYVPLRTLENRWWGDVIRSRPQ